jgi:hypothetical protein
MIESGISEGFATLLGAWRAQIAEFAGQFRDGLLLGCAIELRQDLHDPQAIPELAQGFLALAAAIVSLVGQHRQQGSGRLGA